MTRKKDDGPLFERVGMVYRVVNPDAPTPTPRLPPYRPPFSDAFPELERFTHILQVTDTTGEEPPWEIQIDVISDDEARERRYQLAGWVPATTLVRLFRAQAPGTSVSHTWGRRGC